MSFGLIDPAWVSSLVLQPGNSLQAVGLFKVDFSDGSGRVNPIHLIPSWPAVKILKPIIKHRLKGEERVVAAKSTPDRGNRWECT